MNALVKYAKGSGNMEVRDVPEPSPREGDVKIKVAYAGICGSDLHVYHDSIAIRMNFPVITGHEYSGVITELGKGVEGLCVGDRVISTNYEVCGMCPNCDVGYANLCDERKTFGYWFNGAFAPYTTRKATRILKIPENVSDVSAAMTEPLACVCHAVYDLCKIQPGDLILVTGPGAIGLMAMQVAKAHGGKVIVTGTSADEYRLTLAKQLGADIVVNIDKDDLTAVVMAESRGVGADVVLECSGSPAAIDSALNLIKKLGYFTLIGLPGKKVEFDVEKICHKEIQFSGSFGSRKVSWEQALNLQARGLVTLDPMAMCLPLTQWEEAFKRFEQKEGCKILLQP